MLYIYKFKKVYIVTTETLFNSRYKFINTLNIDIDNHQLTLPKYNTHPINTNLIPTKFGYICILDNIANLKLIEQFDVLKEYPIDETDFVFEIYKINDVVKVFPYPFSFETYYIQCPACYDLNGKPILTCGKCKKNMCKGCSILNNDMCDFCTSEEVDDKQKDEEDEFAALKDFDLNLD